MKDPANRLVRGGASSWLASAGLLLTMAGAASGQTYPTIMPATAPDGTVGVSYLLTYSADERVTWFAGTLTDVCAVSTTNSPIPGLTFNPNVGPNAQLAGVPTQAGMYDYPVSATNTVSVGGAIQTYCSTQHYTIVINGGGSGLTITTTSLPAGTVGQSYSANLMASGGAGGYTFSAPPMALPPGLNLSPSGVISGTPTATGTYNVNFTVTDSASATASSRIPLTINAAGSSVMITTTSLSPGGTGQSYMQTLSARGGSPPYSFTASGLPDGLSISAGGITGTPTMGGSFSVTITVTDSMGAQASHTYILTIDTSLTIATPSLANASVGESYFQQVSAVAGTPPYTFQGFGFPMSLPITSAGIISGTPSPSDAGTFMVEVDVTDAAKHTASAQYTLTIFTLPSITTASPLPAGTVGAAYSQTFAGTGGLSPYTFFVLPTGTTNPLPPGLALDPTGVLSGAPTTAGTFAFTLQVIDKNKNSGTKGFQLAINPGAQPLSVSPASVQFSGMSGGDVPGPQNVMISGSGTPVAFNTQIDDGNGGPAAFLKATPSASTTPAVVRLSIVSNTLPMGTYTARVRGMSVGTPASAALFSVTVTFTVSAPNPKVSVTPGLLQFRATVANPQTEQQTFILRNPGGGGPVPITVTVVGKSPWIASVTPSAQIIQPNAPVLVKVIVVTQGMPVGASRDVIRVTTPLLAPYNQIDVPVSLFIAGQGPALFLSASGVRIPTMQGDQTSRAQQIFVRDTGDPGTSVNWTAQVVRGSSLVVLSTPQGVSTPGNPASFSIRASASAANSPGGESALIQVSDPQSQNSPEFLDVVIDVAAAGTPPGVDPDPDGLAFVATSGSAAPASQKVTLNTNSAAPVAFTVAASTDDGGNWLSASPSATTTSQGSPAQVTVSVTPGASTSTVSTGAVNIAIGSVVSSVDVLLIVKPAGTLTAFETRKAAAACAPSSVAFVETGLVNSFSVPAGYPASLAVQVVDNCGNPLSSAAVVASFSNGDPPLSLSGDQQSGIYTATWQPGIAQPEMTVTLDATSGSLTPAETQLTGNVNPNASLPPSLVTAGLLNNLYPVVGAPLAPGTVAQVYGDNLAPSPASPTIVPLPVVFNGIEALVGGLSSPLFYVSKTQLVVQLPAELLPNKNYSAVLVANGQYSVPQDVVFVPEEPGTVVYSDRTTLVAQHAGTTVLVDAAHPAKPGETLTIYLVGMGATSPAVASGTPAPSNPLASVTSKVQVTIDGQSASISFAGLTPGGVGLYQINFAVPPGAKTGSLDVVITQDGAPANATKLIVAQ